MTPKNPSPQSPNKQTAAPVKQATAPKKAAKKKATKANRGKTGRLNSKKGCDETIPTSIRLTPSGFGSLKVLEAESPEMGRSQITSIALEEKTGRLAYQPPIHLARTRKADLLTIAGLIADKENACNQIFRKLIRAKIDPTRKAQLTDELETEINRLRETRYVVCHVANLPITHDLINDVDFGIATLTEKLRTTTNKAIQTSLTTVIEYLSLHKPIDPSATPKLPTE